MPEQVFGRDSKNRLTINGKSRVELIDTLLEMIEVNSDYNLIGEGLWQVANDIRILGGSEDVAM